MDVPAEDPEYEPETESEYECLNCATVVEAVHPTNCPDCDGILRNRSLPME